MSNYKGPTEGGSGGKKGHSSMEHWSYTEELKESSRVQRRINGKALSKEGTEHHVEESLCDECGSKFIQDKSNYISLCPECAFWIYDAPACDHVFSNNRCVTCGWDGSVSKYVESLKDGEGQD